MTIFTAAVVALYDGKFNSRNIGWAPTYKELRDDINKKGGSLVESKYNYIVIEEVQSGVWGSVVPDSEQWLCWIEGELGGFWANCVKPGELKGTVHWTMY